MTIEVEKIDHSPVDGEWMAEVTQRSGPFKTEEEAENDAVEYYKGIGYVGNMVIYTGLSKSDNGWYWFSELGARVQ